MNYLDPPKFNLFEDDGGKGHYGFGFSRDEKVFIFNWPLTLEDIALRKGKMWISIGELLLYITILAVLWGFFVWNIYHKELLPDLFTLSFWESGPAYLRQYFWGGLLTILFIIYRIMRTNHDIDVVDKGEGDYADVAQSKSYLEVSVKQIHGFKKRDRINISNTFTSKAKNTLEKALKFAKEMGAAEVDSIHIFYALLSSDIIMAIFLRLGVLPSDLQKKIKSALTVGSSTHPQIGLAYQRVVCGAYERAHEAAQVHVSEADLLVATIEINDPLQNALFEMDIDASKIFNVVSWIRARERLSARHKIFAKAAAGRNKYGLDKAMTAVATPFLNQFSKDLTMMAARGYLPLSVARTKEINDIFRAVDGGKNGILLVGEHGVGKMSVLYGIVERMIEERVPSVLHDKRLVQISTTSLLAGVSVSGAQERVLRIVSEVAKAGNIILCIDNVDDLMGGSEGGFDVSEALGEYIRSGRIILFATTTPKAFTTQIARSSFGSVMTPVNINQMDENQAIQVLESKVANIEYEKKVFFSYNALSACVSLASKFITDEPLPSSAIGIMQESAAQIKSKKGEHGLVQPDDVASIIEQKTGIKAQSLTEGEGTKLLRLEDEMHSRVVGQDEAVSLVANALRRARAQVRSTSRPIANFLFLGSTGVGKTELAKTIADVYFGAEDKMIRVDMSEYQDTAGIYRLIGQPNQQGTGLLTQAIHDNPFSLLLLDEIEKAEPRILDLFLQVFDDGRLTDSTGNVVDFTNTIIIATSNAGTPFVQQGIREGRDVESIRQDLIKSELQNHFRPEFLNRFDGIVVFKPLTKSEIMQIASFMLKRVAKDLEQRGVFLRVEQGGLELLAQHGYDPAFGARPMRRAIQEIVENKLAQMILSNELQRRDTVVFDGNFRVEKPLS